MLKKEKLEAISVENGQQAIDLLIKHHFDLVLMDIQMPIMDGYQATAIIRNRLKLTQLPIIAISANVMTTDIEQSKKAGMNGHLGKPINRQEMLQRLEHWLSS